MSVLKIRRKNVCFWGSVKRFGDSVSEDISGSIRRSKRGSLLMYILRAIALWGKQYLEKKIRINFGGGQRMNIVLSEKYVFLNFKRMLFRFLSIESGISPSRYTPTSCFQCELPVNFPRLG